VSYDAHLVGLSGDDLVISASDSAQAKEASQWVVLARTREDLGALTSDSRWQPLPVRADFGLWTDDFSHIISLIKWK
jgi:hypothetical protein